MPRLPLCASVAAAVIAVTPASAAPAVRYAYVGQWHVGDGPAWTSNPGVYSGREAAAVIFGGAAGDYVISTAGPDRQAINFSAFLDGWGDATYLYEARDQDWKYDLGTDGYNAIGGAGGGDDEDWGGYMYSAYSAFVLDHSCGDRYGDASLQCGAAEPGINYAFRIDADTPEPTALALGAAGLAGAVFARVRRRPAPRPQG